MSNKTKDMIPLGDILKEKKIVIKPETRRKGHPSPMYGYACALQEKLELPLGMCFRLLKFYDIHDLQKLVSWWKDYPFKKQNNIPLLYWKIKEMGFVKKEVVVNELQKKKSKKKSRKKRGQPKLFSRMESDVAPLVEKGLV